MGGEKRQQIGLCRRGERIGEKEWRYGTRNEGPIAKGYPDNRTGSRKPRRWGKEATEKKGVDRAKGRNRERAPDNRKKKRTQPPERNNVTKSEDDPLPKNRAKYPRKRRATGDRKRATPIIRIGESLCSIETRKKLGGDGRVISEAKKPGKKLSEARKDED